MILERWLKRWCEFKLHSRVQGLFPSRPINRGQVSAFAKRPPIELSEDGHVEDRRSEPPPPEAVATMGNEANHGSTASRMLWRGQVFTRAAWLNPPIRRPGGVARTPRI